MNNKIRTTKKRGETTQHRKHLEHFPLTQKHEFYQTQTQEVVTLWKPVLFEANILGSVVNLFGVEFPWFVCDQSFFFSWIVVLKSFFVLKILKFKHLVNHDTPVHVVHSRTIAFRQTVHDVHTNTVAFSIQSWSSVVSVLILTDAHTRWMAQDNDPRHMTQRHINSSW